MIKLFKILALCIALQNCAKRGDIHQNSYKIVKMSESADCTVYAMVFEAGNDYLFRFALSGTCNELKEGEYAKLYATFLEDSLNREVPGKAKIIIEWYDFIPVKPEEILAATQNDLQVKAIILEDRKEGLEMELRKD